MSHKVLTSSLITIIAICMYFGNNAFATLENSTNAPRLILKDEKLFDLTYGEWIAKWWQWYINFPKEKHPSLYYLESECGKNQTGPVWFLPDYVASGTIAASEIVERTCYIPSGKYVLMGINTGMYWSDTNETDDRIISQGREGQENAFIFVEINDTKIDVQNNRQDTGIFNVFVPSNNKYTGPSYPAGIYPAYADGYFIFYGPLKPGYYEVFWDYAAGKTQVFGASPVETKAKVLYHLIVE